MCNTKRSTDMFIYDTKCFTNDVLYARRILVIIMTVSNRRRLSAEKNVKYGQAITAITPKWFVDCNISITEMEG